jgi:chemotaxis protein MotC
MRQVLPAILGLLAAALTGAIAAEPDPVPAVRAADVPQVAAPPAASQPAASQPAEPSAQPGPVPQAAARRRPDGPVAWVRTLQLLQDQVAAGSLAAHKSQPLLIARINADLLSAAPDVWADQHNVHAAIVFALSGGGPAILRWLTTQARLGDADATLARGALAYVEGREAEANRLLLDIDAAPLPLTLSAAVTLTQASLSVTDNPIRAVSLLDRVRLLLPGTLSEEGALRREIFTLGQIGDLKKFEILAVQYLRRFPHSIYAGNFRQRLAYQLSQFDVGQDPGRFAALNRILDELDAVGRKELYLTIARAAIQAGKTASAILVSEKALALSAPEDADSSRARLYRAAAEIVNLTTFQSGLRTLRTLDRAKLPASDLPLLDAALATADAIGRGLGGQPSLPAADTASPKPPQAASSPADESASLIPKAQAMIDQVDLLLRKTNP